MDGDFFKNRLSIAVIAFFLLGIFLLAIGGGLFFFRGSNSGNDDIQIISSNETGSSGSAPEIVVHVDGAVGSPGIYRLASDSRVDDAIKAAGGLTSDADQSRINLAAKVSDGQKIHIASQGEAGSSVMGQVSGESTGLININTASESQLDRLPGVGPVTAGKIIASRPYSAPEDLLTKKVVSSSVFEKIKDLITVY